MNGQPSTYLGSTFGACKESCLLGRSCLGTDVFVAVPNLLSRGEWGWLQTTSGSWDVNWTILPEASQACQGLLKCGCKSSANVSRLIFNVLVCAHAKVCVTVNETLAVMIPATNFFRQNYNMILVLSYLAHLSHLFILEYTS